MLITVIRGLYDGAEWILAGLHPFQGFRVHGKHQYFITAFLGIIVPVFKGGKLYSLQGEREQRWQNWELNVLTPTPFLQHFLTHVRVKVIVPIVNWRPWLRPLPSPAALVSHEITVALLFYQGAESC